MTQVKIEVYSDGKAQVIKVGFLHLQMYITTMYITN